ncbi:hypothetical protein [Jannaschia sp. W003]|uniref:hypothetical protein n=1 Tax=Jannaschia sp. W003 TaxID=2867012 RepID=UPI0021A3302E|nr:hypothetical protein [Jannaschia sp. W003]UWQ22841.1 hypothetical protein K3554_07410 [Jannaschia sp. W003]
MSENVENLILTQLREIRDEQHASREERAAFRSEVKRELKDLRSLIGGQGVILTSIAGYIHQVEERVEALEGDTE